MKKSLFSSVFNKLLASIPYTGQGFFLSIYSDEISKVSALAGYDTAFIFASDGSLKDTLETQSLRMLMSLFHSVGLQPGPGTKSANYASNAMLALSNLIANIARTQSPEFTMYADCINVLYELEQYRNNLLEEGWYLKSIPDS